MEFSTLFSTKKIIFIPKRTCKLLCYAILLAALFWLLRSCYRDSATSNIRVEGLSSIQISSTAYPYLTYFVDKSSATLTNKKLYYEISSDITDIPTNDYYTFTLFYEDEQQVVLYYSSILNAIYNSDYQLLKTSSDLKEVLLNLTAIYSQEAHKSYGALLPWEEANEIFPMFATAKITDIYSGASFYVQRREGSSHVDAQPLTAEDTAIMKNIYNNQWSWDRKGIIVEIGGYRIAASMHGMPHGGGKIADNNFPGHFCIHFFGSLVHGGGMDTQHHREILKAAGKLPLNNS